MQSKHSGVRSKVAGNIRTQNRVSQKQLRESWATIGQLESQGLPNSLLKSAYPKTWQTVIKKSTKSALKADKTVAVRKSPKKSPTKRPETADYQAVIDSIKSKFNEAELNKMSVADLQAEIMPQVVKLEENKKRAPIAIEVEEEEQEILPR